MFWCGGNEIDDPAQSPPPDIQQFMSEFLASEDGDGTRLYMQSSMNDYGNDYALAPSDGPYGIQQEVDFYSQLPFGFRVVWNPEIGNIGIPVVESLQRTMVKIKIEERQKQKELQKKNSKIKIIKVGILPECVPDRARCKRT